MKIALPKGRLLPGVLDVFQKAGITFTFADESRTTLFLQSILRPVVVSLARVLKKAGVTIGFASSRDYNPKCSDSFFSATLFKPRAIPQLIDLGLCDVGFCGLDIMKEAGYFDVVDVLNLGLNKVVVVVAVPKGQENFLANPPKRPVVIATEYPKTASKWAMAHNLAHINLFTGGSTEGYAPRFADLIVDCVETGDTMGANHQHIVETLFESATCMIVNRTVMEDYRMREAILVLKHRLSEALKVKE